jgi:hypothetical protein
MKRVTENHYNYTEKLETSSSLNLFLETSVFNIALKIHKRKYGATSSVTMATRKQFGNTYVTIKLQNLPTLFTSLSI